MAKRKSTKPASKSRGKGDSTGGGSAMHGDLKVAQIEVAQMSAQLISVQMEQSVESSSVPKSKSNRIVICKHVGCNDVATSHDFCRLHYLSNWKKLKSKEAKTQGLGLEIYLKELSSRFPEEFFEKLRADIEELSADTTVEPEESSESMGRGLFDVESDEDMDDIMKGIRIEDY